MVKSKVGALRPGPDGGHAPGNAAHCPTGGLKDTVEAGKGGGRVCFNLKSLVVLRWFNHVPSGKLTQLWQKSPFLMGKSTN